VLETLTAARASGFVLHDMFSVPFDEIAQILDRSRRPRDSSRAGDGDACEARRRSQTQDSRAATRVVKRFSPRRARG